VTPVPSAAITPAASAVGQELQIGGGEDTDGRWMACGEILGMSSSLGGP